MTSICTYIYHIVIFLLLLIIINYNYDFPCFSYWIYLISYWVYLNSLKKPLTQNYLKYSYVLLHYKIYFEVIYLLYIVISNKVLH